MNKNNCSILVLSCDKNLDLLKYFFSYFYKFWSDCPFQIYVGLEEEKINNASIVNLNCNSGNWSGRVKSYLNAIPTDNVLIFLDDFLIEKNVQSSVILNNLKIIENCENVVNVAFCFFEGKRIKYNFIDNFDLRVKRSNCLVNWQIGLWNKMFLLDVLIDHESPWESELYGSIRASKYKDAKFLCLSNDQFMPIVYSRGWLVVQGFWNEKEVERLNKLNVEQINTGERQVKNGEFSTKSIYQRIQTRIDLLIYSFIFLFKRGKHKKYGK